MEKFVAGFKEWAPYLALELVMPGGTVMALLLYLRRRHNATRAMTTQVIR